MRTSPPQHGPRAVHPGARGDVRRGRSRRRDARRSCSSRWTPPLARSSASPGRSSRRRSRSRRRRSTPGRGRCRWCGRSSTTARPSSTSSTQVCRRSPRPLRCSPPRSRREPRAARVAAAQPRTRFHRAGPEALQRQRRRPLRPLAARPDGKRPQPTVRFVTPAQTVCNYGTLLFRNFSSAVAQGANGGRWQRISVFEPPQGPNNEGSYASAPANGGGTDPDNFLHYNPYPNTASPGQPHECEAGNETYAVGRQVIGDPPGNQGTTTADQPGSESDETAESSP